MALFSLVGAIAAGTIIPLVSLFADPKNQYYYGDKANRGVYTIYGMAAASVVFPVVYCVISPSSHIDWIYYLWWY